MAVATCRKWFDLRSCFFSGIVLVGLYVVFAPLPIFGQGTQAIASPEQKPSGLVVSYRSGQLTIDARNSPLSAILSAVSKQTGAVIDFPPDANELLTMNTGPGPIEDSLASLLKGSSYNFTITRLTDPKPTVHVVLSSKGTGSAAPESVQTPAAAAAPPVGIGQWGGNDDPAKFMEDRRQAVAERRQTVRRMIDERLMEKRMEADEKN